MRFTAVIKTLFSSKPKGPLPPYNLPILSATTMGSVPSSAASSGSSLALTTNHSSEELSPLLLAVATADFTANAAHEVDLVAGHEYIVLTHGQEPSSWSTVKSTKLGGAVGRVPTAYIKIVAPKGRTATPGTSRKSLLVVDEITKLEGSNDPPDSQEIGAPPPAPAVNQRHQTGLCAFVEKDVKAVHDGQLEVEKGDLVLVLAQDPVWTFARTVGRLGDPGWIPTSSIRIIDPVSGENIDSSQVENPPSLDVTDSAASLERLRAHVTSPSSDASNEADDHLVPSSGASFEAALECTAVAPEELVPDISPADTVVHGADPVLAAAIQAAVPMPALSEPEGTSVPAISSPSSHLEQDSTTTVQDPAIQIANAPEPKPEEKADMLTPKTACTLQVSERHVSLLTPTGEADAEATEDSSVIVKGVEEGYGVLEFPQPGEGQVVFRGHFRIPGENLLELEKSWTSGEMGVENRDQKARAPGRLGHYTDTPSSTSSSAVNEGTPIAVASPTPSPPTPIAAPPFPYGCNPFASRCWPKVSYTFRVLGDDYGDGNVLLPGRYYHDLSAQGYHREEDDLWFHIEVKYTPCTSAGGDTPTYSFLLFRQFEEVCSLHQELAMLVPEATESFRLNRKRKCGVLPEILHHGLSGAVRDDQWATEASVLLGDWLAAVCGLSLSGHSTVYSHPLIHGFLQPWSVDRISQVPKGDEWAVAAGSDRGCWPEELHPCKVRRVQLGPEVWPEIDAKVVLPRRTPNPLLVELPSTGEKFTVAEPDNLTLQALLQLVDATFGDIGDGEFYVLKKTFNGGWTPEGTRCLGRWGTLESDSQMKQWLDTTGGQGGKRYIAVAPPAAEEGETTEEYAEEEVEYASDASTDDGEGEDAGLSRGEAEVLQEQPRSMAKSDVWWGA
ncbi:hypothetical protein IAT38_002409 [Cryptococcus sp. DSM 104549]